MGDSYALHRICISYTPAYTPTYKNSNLWLTYTHRKLHIQIHNQINKRSKKPTNNERTHNNQNVLHFAWQQTTPKTHILSLQRIKSYSCCNFFLYNFTLPCVKHTKNGKIDCDYRSQSRHTTFK